MINGNYVYDDSLKIAVKPIKKIILEFFYDYFTIIVTAHVVSSAVCCSHERL